MPFPYFSTSSPTSLTKNSINKTSVDFGIRDFLLKRNIHNPTKYPAISTNINGSPKVGEPVLNTMIGDGYVRRQAGIEADSIFRYDIATIMNRFKDKTPSAGDLTNVNTVPFSNTSFPNSTATNGVSNYPHNLSSTGIMAKTDDKKYRGSLVNKNLYVDKDKQVDAGDFLSINPLSSGRQLTNYVDNFGSININDRVINSIDGLLRGGGLNFRTTIANRTLRSQGFGNETALGVIANQELLNALKSNTRFNVIQQTIGQVNLNPIQLLRGAEFIKPDYTITIGSTTGGRVLDFAERLLGFETPVSRVNMEGSIFSTESGSVSNIARANELLKSTGKGQVQALQKQFYANMNGISKLGYGSNDNPNLSVFRSGYSPAFQVNNKNILAGKPNLYAFYDERGFVNNFIGSIDKGNPIPKVTSSRELEQYGFNSFEDYYGIFANPNKPTFSWGASQFENLGNGTSATTNRVNTNPNTRPFVGFSKKNLLSKTQTLFNSFGMKTIVSNKGAFIQEEPNQLQTSVVRGAISKGSAVQSKKSLDGSVDSVDDIFCRSWTTYHRYGKVGDLIRHRGLDGTNRNDIKGSVLDNNGFVKMAPIKGENHTRTGANVKQYMLSIENLAWAGAPADDLLPVEQGPGDLLTGKYGRIMWFPPYDINFTENNSAAWESTSFIGRGEPVYTYTNSERTGTLSFKIIVDHPNQMNSFKDDTRATNDYIASYFAGCNAGDTKVLDRLTLSEQSKAVAVRPTKKVAVPIEEQVKPPSFEVFFLNDRTDILTNYDVVEGVGYGNYMTEPQTRNGVTGPSRPQVDRFSYGLNAKSLVLDGVTYNGWTDINFQEKMKKHLKEKCPSCKVNIQGYASSQGFKETNDKLATDRAKNFFTWFKDNMLPVDDINGVKRDGTVKGNGARPNTGTANNASDERAVKEARKVVVSFTVDASLSSDAIVEEINNSEQKPEPTPVDFKVNQNIVNRFYDETNFFEKLTDDSPMVFDKIRDKIKYFHPAFHSTTPEGLNSRLTFLNQCTRQGPTIKDGNPANLAFGRPPVCILRLGDFYNTKIVIENIDYSFDPLVWDLNPEGIGVQPMIANVNMSFKFIGGSSLQSPLNKLQNALSFNYYANSQVYDARADYVNVQSLTGTTLENTFKTFKSK